MRHFSIQELLLINQYAQDCASRQEVMDWYLSFNEDEKQFFLQELWRLAIQAQTIEADLPLATKSAGLKPTHNPVVMLSKGNISYCNRGYKLSTLRGTILDQAFLLVLECFTIAEKRKKQKENGVNCNHWWHRDLSNTSVVEEILRNQL
jgi:hypothetical protein